MWFGSTYRKWVLPRGFFHISQWNGHKGPACSENGDYPFFFSGNTFQFSSHRISLSIPTGESWSSWWVLLSFQHTQSCGDVWYLKNQDQFYFSFILSFPLKPPEWLMMCSVWTDWILPVKLTVHQKDAVVDADVEIPTDSLWRDLSERGWLAWFLH